jgi:alanine racemase
LFNLQRERFSRAQQEIEGLGIRPRLLHAANSAALLRDDRTWYDLVRPGLLLYGVVPPPMHVDLNLRPVMTLQSRVVAVKGMRPGEGLGYGVRFAAAAPTTIAVVPAGYADGLDVRLAGRGSALVCGRRVPIVGCVCMDMIMLDVSGLDVKPGDEVVLMGDQDAERIDVLEVARTIDTIPYEVLCRIGTRIERIYNSRAS